MTMLKNLLAKLLPGSSKRASSVAQDDTDDEPRRHIKPVSAPVPSQNTQAATGHSLGVGNASHTAPGTEVRPPDAPHILDGNPQFKIVQQSFDRIAVRLKLVWGHKEFRPYMDGLLHDTRAGARKGFPATVLFALHALSEEHDESFPEFRAKGDRWSGHMDDLDRQGKSKF